MNPNETTSEADRRAVEDELRRQWLAGRTADGATSPPPDYVLPLDYVPPPSAPPADASAADAPAGGTPYYAAPPPYTPPPGRPPSRLEQMKSRGGILGWIASLLLLLFKIGGPVLAVAGKLKFLLLGSKLLLTGGSMLVSMWAWGLLYGWSFGVGLVILIFIHECGHALAARRLGIPTGIMVFIPMMGAFVTTKRGAKNIVEDAYIGIMGPVFGALSGVGCLALYWLLSNHSPYWLALAQVCFLMNLFNLAPTPPLDGGWITPLFSPKLLALGAVLLLFLVPLNPLIGLLALLSLPRIISGWKANPEESDFYQATAADRWRYGAAYLGLAAFLALGYYGLHAHLVTLPRPVM